MASIPTPPFKLSLVTDEWKNKSIKACGDKAGLTTPFNCTEFVGKSDWVFVKLRGNNNYDFNTFYNACDSALGGAWSGKQLHIILESGFVSKATNVPCIKLDRNFTQLSGCILDISGYILGRGGAGGSGTDGGSGGTAIQLSSGVKVSINNMGIIGGGGGGASLYNKSGGGGGGGGALGAASNLSYDQSDFITPAQPGKMLTGGAGAINHRSNGKGGTGGNVGSAGESTKNYKGGAAGKAINVSGGTITWIAKGDVRGAVS